MDILLREYLPILIFLAMAIGLGLVLILIILALNALAWGARQWSERHAG